MDKWLASAKGFISGWSGWINDLASVNGILRGWPGC
jgi:hypothetical protein